ncbi:MAG: hypothetical protein PHX08_13610 [Lachnospiraceae bacterium]|nr:hypothetical protein [Lachnospiraceae bacterium]
MNKIEIDIPHFYCLEYIEGNKKMNVDIDFREFPIYFKKSLIQKWETPYSEEEVSEKKKEEIYQNIKEYLLERYRAEDIIEE